MIHDHSMRELPFSTILGIVFSEKILHAPFLSNITLRTYSRHIKQLTSYFDVTLELA